MAACVDRLDWKLQGRWAQSSGGVDRAACQQTADFLSARDGEPVRVVDHSSGQVVQHSSRRRR